MGGGDRLLNASVTWWEALPALLAAFVLVFVPGLIASAPLRVGLVARLAVAGTMSVASIGVAGVVFGALGVPFAGWQALVPAAIVGAAGYLFRRRWPTWRLRADRVRPLWIIASILGAATIVAVVAFADVPDPSAPSQTYDNVFHLSAAAAIFEGGDASSLTLRTLIEPGRTWSFYPAAWHSLVAATAQVSGGSLPVAANVVWIAIVAVVWIPGVMWLAQSVIPSTRPGRVALVAAPLGAAFGAMPYALLSWGTLYPTFLAHALLPAAVATTVLAVRGGRRRSAATLVAGATMLVISIVAVGVSQPRAFASWILVVLPFLLFEIARRAVRVWRRGGRSRTALIVGGTATVIVAVIAGVVAFAVVAQRFGLYDRPLDERLAGPQARATQTVGDGIVEVFAQQWLTGGGASVTAPSILLALAVIAGIVAAVRRRGLRWLVVSYAVVALLYAVAAGSDDVVTKLVTAIWYKDRFRIAGVLPVIGVVLATLGIVVVARWFGRRRAARPAAIATVAVAAAWTVAVSSAVVIALSGGSAAVAGVFRLPPSDAALGVVSADQIAFLRTIPDTVPEGQRVLGDPWDGSAWSQAFGQREPVFPHVNGQWDSARLVLADRLDAIATDPAVCAALDDLRVRYVLFDPHEFAGGDPAGNRFSAIHRAVDAGLFDIAATDGTTTLFRITQCGELPPHT